ncbi:MAG: IMP cyclohydrolase [Deltaproteobacteria bacterium]|nr:IMP cyclohydrolase [Deltaproteobacteria bacterium]
MPKIQYRQILGDSFPAQVELKIGQRNLVYQKQLFASAEAEPQGLRYGENPGQAAALYRLTDGQLTLGDQTFVGPNAALISALGQKGLMSGGQKHPSMTNFTDLNAALSLLRWLTKPAAVIVKHNNPSGAAQGGTLASCFTRAYRADQLSAFGGVVAFNRPLDVETAKLVGQLYVEVVAAPDFEEGTTAILAQKPDVRVFQLPNLDQLKTCGPALQIKSLIDGGLILHEPWVNAIKTPQDFLPAKVERKGQVYAANRTPTPQEYEDLIFAWAVIGTVSSNSVVIVRDETTVAIAGGQQSRLGVVQLAIDKAYHNFCQLRAQELKQTPYWRLARSEDPSLTLAIATEAKNCRAGLIGASLASDGFFPFPDAVLTALDEGVTAFAHPGGSLDDWESIETVNNHLPPAAMVFTGQRAFQH